MPIKTIPAERWREVLPLLRESRVVAIPTDTVYGVAAMPEDEAAVDGIYAAKDRPSDKALPMLISSLEQAERIGLFDDRLRILCSAFWPGALTVVAAALPSFHSPAIADDGTV